MEKIAYLGMDVHARNCVLANMDDSGTFIDNFNFKTSENNIINALNSINAKDKYLALEEGTLAHWAAQVASPYVSQVIICDPRENALIYKSPHKKDPVDTRKLCRLLRLGELKQVYHPQDDARAIFKAAVQHYHDLSHQLARFKQKIKAMYRHWGVIDVFGDSVYGTKQRERFVQQVKHQSIRQQLNRLYHLVDQSAAMKQSAKKSMKQLGRKYPEIREFTKMPGIGSVGAHTFDAYIQTPYRFAKDSRLWRYCRLGVTDRSSDGKPLGFKRLDPSGVAELKSLSYRAFMAAMKGENEVKRFYHQSLQCTRNRKHARLNTQRKILSVMLTIWKKGDTYQPELFLAPSK